MKLKGSVGAYLTALEEEIERVKHQRSSIPGFRGEYLAKWDAYIKELEDRRVEACLLMEFEEDDIGDHESTVIETVLLGDEDDE